MRTTLNFNNTTLYIHYTSSLYLRLHVHCILVGSRVRIENGIITDWQRVEDDFEEKYLDGSYAPHGLQLSRIISKTPVLHLVFTPAADYNHSALYAQCALDHPFFVKDKGKLVGKVSTDYTFCRIVSTCCRRSHFCVF